MRSQIGLAAHMVQQATHVVALTGAGISTPSGVPDFRSPDSGLWRHVNPLEVASLWAFYAHPAVFYDWIRPIARRLLMAEPNGAHRALAALERHGCLEAIITQNVDSLHQRAGSHRVLEIHGHARSATCLRCGHRTSTELLWPAVVRGDPPPVCSCCGGLVKPDVVLFGEPLPYEVLSQAQQAALNSDVMLVIGTSLEVMPAADLPLLAKRRGARLILVNRDPTPYDAAMDIILRGDVVPVLSHLADAVID